MYKFHAMGVGVDCTTVHCMEAAVYSMLLSNSFRCHACWLEPALLHSLPTHFVSTFFFDSFSSHLTSNTDAAATAIPAATSTAAPVMTASLAVSESAAATSLI